MAKKVYEPKAVLILEAECDRCGKKVREELEESEAAGDQLPAGWVEVQHPEGIDGVSLTFCQRACTSTWFAAWVRRLYHVPEPPPRRRRSEIVAEPVEV